MNTTQATQLAKERMEQLSRPDSKLPRELRHDAIVAVRELSSSDRFAYEIVFDHTAVPLGYARRIRDEDWEITNARVEQAAGDGLLGLFGRGEPRQAVVVATDVPSDLLGGGSA